MVSVITFSNDHALAIDVNCHHRHAVYACEEQQSLEFAGARAAYLEQADAIPHRAEGEAALLEFLPSRVNRILDLGSGDGRLLALVRLVHSHFHGIALDFSDAMIERLKERFASDLLVEVVRHDLDAPLQHSMPRLMRSFPASRSTT